jgi:ribonucleotide reductase alpha subunit
MSDNKFLAITGRVETFIKTPERGTLPVSCTLYDLNTKDASVPTHFRVLWNSFKFSALALKYNAGVKMQLGNYREVHFNTKGADWKWYLAPGHPDWHEVPYSELPAYLKTYHKSDITNLSENEVLIDVDDSMLDGDMSITYSWWKFIKVLLDGQTPVVNLSKLRPFGMVNDKGMVATGVFGSGEELKLNPTDSGSFLAIYWRLFNYFKKLDLATLLQVYGQINKTICRGGVVKSGIICTGMDYTSPLAEKYMKIPLSGLVGNQKKAMRVDAGLLTPEYEHLIPLIVQKVNEESMFLEKIQGVDSDGEPLFSNVCVSGETWVTTDEGAKQVKDLVGKPFIAKVNGQHYPCLQGFHLTGHKDVVKLVTKEGYSITATPDHKLMSAQGTWQKIQDMKPGDKLMIIPQVANENTDNAEVVSVIPVGSEDVYDCTVEGLHAYDANGFYTSNCVEILQRHGSSCLLSHVHGGTIKKPEDLIEAIPEVTQFLCNLHNNWRNQVPDFKAQIFLPREEDKQIGVGFVGLANMLAHLGITYAEHISSLNKVVETLKGCKSVVDVPNSSEYPLMSVSDKVAYSLALGYSKAAKLLKDSDIERAFTMAPCQSIAYRYKDLEGNTLSRSIDPPTTKRVRRSSQRVKTEWYFHGKKIETAKDLSPNDHELHWELWQELMELASKLGSGRNMAHTMSYDLWHHIDADWLRYFILESPLKTTYYNFADSIDASYLNKGIVQKVVVEETPTECDLSKGFCSTCSE